MLYLFSPHGADTRDGTIYRYISDPLKQRVLENKVRMNSQSLFAKAIREAASLCHRAWDDIKDEDLFLQRLSVDDYVCLACEAAVKWMRAFEYRLGLDENSGLPTSAGNSNKILSYQNEPQQEVKWWTSTTLALAAYTSHPAFLYSNSWCPPQSIFAYVIKQSHYDDGSPFLGTPLIAAAMAGSSPAVTTLVHGGAIVDIEYKVNRLRGTAFCAAARYGHFHTLRTLFSEGGDRKFPELKPNSELLPMNCFPLAAAIEYGSDLEMIYWLIEQTRPFPDRGRLYGQAVHFAIWTRRQDLALMVIENAPGGVNPYFCIVTAYPCLFVTASLCQCDQVLAVFLDWGIPPDWRATPYAINPTVLIQAAMDGNLAITKLFVERGANVNILHNRHGTALHCAVLKQHTSVVRYLLANGADTTMAAICRPVNEGYEGVPLMGAVLCGNTGIVELILQHEVNVARQWGKDDNLLLVRQKRIIYHVLRTARQTAIKPQIEDMLKRYSYLEGEDSEVPAMAYAWE
jgi:hypothetical protein